MLMAIMKKMTVEPWMRKVRELKLPNRVLVNNSSGEEEARDRRTRKDRKEI